MPIDDPTRLTPRNGSIYPLPYAERMAGRSSLRLGQADGLTRLVVVGTKAAVDVATYSDVDLKEHTTDGTQTFMYKDGTDWTGPR